MHVMTAVKVEDEEVSYIRLDSDKTTRFCTFNSGSEEAINNFLVCFYYWAYCQLNADSYFETYDGTFEDFIKACDYQYGYNWEGIEIEDGEVVSQ